MDSIRCIKFFFKISRNNISQVKYCNNSIHDHYGTNRTIPIIFLDTSHSVHDSHIAGCGKIFDKREYSFGKTVAKCTDNSAFRKVKHEYLIQTSQEISMVTGQIESQRMH